MTRLLQDIATLRDAMAKAGIDKLDLSEGELSISINLSPDPVPPELCPAEAPAEGMAEISSPWIGRFSPLRETGASVVKGEIVGVISAGLIRLPIVAPQACVITRQGPATARSCRE